MPPTPRSASAQALGDCTAEDRQALADRLGTGAPSPTCAARSSPDQARRVAALNLDGIGFIKESQRFYPNKELAAHLLGYVGVDNTGLNGLEATYDSKIRGKPGTMLVQTDARRHAFSRVERPPTSGSSVELTHRRVPAAHRRARAPRRRPDQSRAGRLRHRHESAHRRDPGDGERADVQPERVPRLAGERAPQPCRPGSLRAGLDVQDRDGVRGARREGDGRRRVDRHQPGAAA